MANVIGTNGIPLPAPGWSDDPLESQMWEALWSSGSGQDYSYLPVSVWKEIIGVVVPTARKALEAEIAALREPMACGHVRAFWTNMGPSHSASHPEIIFPETWICTACEDKRLAVAQVFDQFADIALSVYGIEAGTHTPASLLQAVREQTVKKIRPWLLHDDECAKLTNDDGVKCTCGLDESVCALVKVGAR